MTEWKWSGDGKSVEVQTDTKEILRFEGATIKEREWLEYYDRMADIGETYKILRTAKDAFRTGAASYVDAFENLRALVVEHNRARSATFQVAQDVDVFFSPEGIVKAFAQDQQGLIEFAMEFVARTYTRSISGSRE